MLASPECTNHTMARGSRRINHHSRATARFVLNFAAELLPRWVVIENVIQMRDWKGYGPLIAELEDLDYNLLPITLDARDFGVPQQRRRLFLLCDREGDPIPPVPGSRREAGTRTRIGAVRPGSPASRMFWNASDERLGQAHLLGAELVALRQVLRHVVRCLLLPDDQALGAAGHSRNSPPTESEPSPKFALAAP